MKLIKSSTVLLLLLSKCIIMEAQDTKVIRDMHLWSGVGIEKSFKNNLSISLDQEIRFKQNITEINNYFTEIGLRYRISKNFSLEGGYRFTRDKNSDNSYDNLTRYNLDLRYKGKINPITIYYRLRYQKEVEGMNLLDQSIPYEKYVRNRLSVRYNKLGKIKPYISLETFQLFRPLRVAEFEYIRFLCGIKYEPRKIGEFNLAYGFNREVRSNQPAMVYTLKIHYTYIF